MITGQELVTNDRDDGLLDTVMAETLCPPGLNGGALTPIGPRRLRVLIGTPNLSSGLAISLRPLKSRLLHKERPCKAGCLNNTLGYL